MIRVWDYLNEMNEERAEIREAIDSVLDSGMLILGDNVKGFESEFAAYCGAGYGIGMNSATDALFLSLKAWGIGPGDEVITVSNTAVPTVSAIAATGATPRFVDVHGDTALMDVSKLEAALTDKTRAVIPVHLYGQCVDMDALKTVVSSRNIKILEDCAQSHGSLYKGRMSGSIGDLAAFSFYPTKILGTYGDGGMVLSQDEESAEKLRRLRFYGMKGTYFSVEDGYNSRLDELHAAILRKKLTHLDDYLARRRELAGRYDGELAGTDFILPQVADGNTHSYYIYVVRHSQRERVMEYLRANDIHVNISYPWPIHTMPAFESSGYKEGDFPVTEALAKEIFSLPMYPSLTDEEQSTVIRVLKEFA